MYPTAGLLVGWLVGVVTAGGNPRRIKLQLYPTAKLAGYWLYYFFLLLCFACFRDEALPRCRNLFIFSTLYWPNKPKIKKRRKKHKHAFVASNASKKQKHLKYLQNLCGRCSTNKHEKASTCVFCPFNPFCRDCPAPALDQSWNRWSPHKQEHNFNPDSSWILMAKVALLPAKPILTLPWQAKWR